jgi:electron transport complex protein RnfB
MDDNFQNFLHLINEARELEGLPVLSRRKLLKMAAMASASLAVPLLHACTFATRDFPDNASGSFGGNAGSGRTRGTGAGGATSFGSASGADGYGGTSAITGNVGTGEAGAGSTRTANGGAAGRASGAGGGGTGGAGAGGGPSANGGAAGDASSAGGYGGSSGDVAVCSSDGSEEVYRRLATALDALPSGFPPALDGAEIPLLKKIFCSEEAELFCDLRLTFESAAEVAKRTGRPEAGLEEKLTAMCQRGEIMGRSVNGQKQFKMAPWVPGIFEGQLNRMDLELCNLVLNYTSNWGIQQMLYKPQVFRILPVAQQIPTTQQALPYQQVSTLIENGAQYRVLQCICKKGQGMIGNPCKKPLQEVCMVILPEEGLDPFGQMGRLLSKEEAYQLLDDAEEAGLVHLTTNVQSGNWFICNCCSCCCGALKSINAVNSANAPGLVSTMVNSDFRVEIDPALCKGCGKCKNERCQVNAVVEADSYYQVIAERCIGCGLCASTCPTGAAKLISKPKNELIATPVDDAAWNDERARNRGIDYSKYK